MSKYICALLLLACISCKSKQDKMIDAFSNKVDQFDTQVDSLKDSTNIDQLMRTADELSTQMDSLNAMDLSDKQHQMVSMLALKLSVSISAVEQHLQDELQKNIDTTKMEMDTTKMMMNSMDTLK